MAIRFVLDTIFPIASFYQEKDIHQAWIYTQNGELLREIGFWGILLSEFYGYFFDLPLAIIRLHELQSYYREQNRPWELANTQNFLAVISFVEVGTPQ